MLVTSIIKYADTYIGSELGSVKVDGNINPLTPNYTYRGRTAPLTSKAPFHKSIQRIYVLHILNMVCTLRFFIQNAVCFIILTYLVPVVFTFYIFIQQI